MISSGQTLTFWPFAVALTLNAVIRFSPPQDTLAYDDVSSLINTTKQSSSQRSFVTKYFPWQNVRDLNAVKCACAVCALPIARKSAQFRSSRFSQLHFPPILPHHKRRCGANRKNNFHVWLDESCFVPIWPARTDTIYGADKASKPLINQSDKPSRLNGRKPSSNRQVEGSSWTLRSHRTAQEQSQQRVMGTYWSCRTRYYPGCSLGSTGYRQTSSCSTPRRHGQTGPRLPLPVRGEKVGGQLLGN